MWCKSFIFLLYKLELTWTASINSNSNNENLPTHFVETLNEIFSSEFSFLRDDERIHYETEQVDFVFNDELSSTMAELPNAEVNWNDNDTHSFLRLTTPSGKIYYVTQYGIFVCKENEGTLSSNLPYIAYGSINGKMYLIRYLYDQPDISVIHGTSQSQLDSETEIRLISFVGVNKKRYLVVNHVNHSIITEAATIQDDSVDYLEISFLMNDEVFVLTLTPNGSDVIDIVNCTESAFLTIAFPNQKIAIFYQFINVGTPFLIDSTNVTSSPYITFNNVDGAKYDIHFPPTGSDGRPTIVRDKSQPRNKCVANELLNFDGLDRRRYKIDLKNDQLLDSQEMNKNGNLEVSFGVANEVINNYEFVFDGNEDIVLDSRFGDSDKPSKPMDDRRINFKCLVSCIG